MPVARKAGAVVYASSEGEIYLALVHDVFGHWTLTKGSVEKDEKPEEAVVREAKEELGLSVTVKKLLGDNTYIAYDPEIGKMKKQVTYFLVESSFDDVKKGDSGGLDDARWFKLADILDLNFYDDILPIVTKAINILLKK